MNQKSPLLTNVDWAIYSLKESFSLFELACLIHSHDPKAVSDDAITAIRQMGAVAQDAFMASSNKAALMLADPGMYFVPPIGDTLERLKKATGLQLLGEGISKTRAKEMAEALGYQWPQPLSGAMPEAKETSAEPFSSSAALKLAETTSNSNLKTPSPLPTGDVAHAFDGLRGWSEKAWKDTLGSPPKWLESCLVLRGQRGVREHHWNPVLIGAALVHNGHTKQNSVRARFQTKPLLKDWLEAWKTYEADNFDT